MHSECIPDFLICLQRGSVTDIGREDHIFAEDAATSGQLHRVAGVECEEFLESEYHDPGVLAVGAEEIISCVVGFLEACRETVEALGVLAVGVGNLLWVSIQSTDSLAYAAIC